ncbi:MAG: hydrogenase expression/formation protein HypE [Deltaproteobacteria bacterium]|nr:hydrogenase expression/formation protein HypE [Deltaproteobacteria bacterium]
MKIEQITLDHGSGGEASRELVETVFVSRLKNNFLDRMDDSAIINLFGHNLAMTTDSYVVDPIFFPGGNIGSLSIHGTVNDLAMQGASPLFLTLGLILEEGFPLKDLEIIIDSLARAAEEAGVKIVAGDTKVVPRGNVDKIFINTAGIGIIPKDIDVSSSNARHGDLVLINGDIGDHGMAILTRREGLSFNTQLESDSASLNSLVDVILESGKNTHVLRDPTRGGVATALNEIAAQSGVGIQIFEADLPISKPAEVASEILGLDPLYLANEGKCLIIAPPEDAHLILSSIKEHRHGKNARIIGKVTSDNPGRVLLKTKIGGNRIIATLTGEQLPRIC